MLFLRLMLIFLLLEWQLQAAAENTLQQANQEFSRQNFDKSATLYRRHVNKNPRDFNAWSALGASYFHMGLPRKALKTLQKVENITANKSFNYFYQGLCYSALKLDDSAVKYFTFTSQANDDYGSRAVFELAVIFYKKQEWKQSRVWAAQYLQRFPNGYYRLRAQELIQSIQDGKEIPDIQGIPKPDMEKAAYKYSSLSLFPIPHYWFIKSGVDGKSVEGYQPAGPPLGALDQRTSVEYGFNLDAGIGLGPWRESGFIMWGGYNYRQHWLIEQETLDDWFKYPSDLSYFPLKSNLMERKHQFYGDMRRELFKNFYAGLYGSLQFRRVGSSLFPSPEDDDLKVVINVSDTTLLIPWVGYAFTDNIRTLFYWYLRKEINHASPEFSNKTFDFSGTSGDPALSLGLSSAFDFPTINLETNVDLFQYEFIYNDVWLDYTRTGFIASAQYEFLKYFFVNGIVGVYQDQYKVDRIQFRPCSDDAKIIEDGQSTTSSRDFNSCQRVDMGKMYGVGGGYSPNQNLRFSAKVTMVSNESTKEFTEEKMIFLFEVMWAFPSVKRVVRLTERMADVSFTKEND